MLTLVGILYRYTYVYVHVGTCTYIHCTYVMYAFTCIRYVCATTSESMYFTYNIFEQTCKEKLNHMLPLEAYLLKPVQRVLKYSLLLEVYTCTCVYKHVHNKILLYLLYSARFLGHKILGDYQSLKFCGNMFFMNKCILLILIDVHVCIQ